MQAVKNPEEPFTGSRVQFPNRVIVLNFRCLPSGERFIVFDEMGEEFLGIEPLVVMEALSWIR